MFSEFFEKYKKIIFMTLFVLVILVLGYLLYIVFFRGMLGTNEATPPQAATSTKPGELPTAGKNTLTPSGETTIGGGRLFPITNEIKPIANEVANGGVTKTTDMPEYPAISPTAGADGNDVQFYNTSDGKFYRIDQNGNATALSDRIFNSVQKVTWSPDKEKAIMEFPDQSKIIYNFTTKDQITLPSHWTDFDFSKNGDQIVLKSLGQDPDNRWLAIINADGTKAMPIEDIGTNDATVYPSWSPNNLSVAMYTKGVDFDRQEVFFVGLNGENFKSTIIDGRDFRPKWAPDGNRLLYSVYSSNNDMKPMLWVVDANGDTIGNERHSLQLETWSDKCTFYSASELYCAVPETLQEGAGLFPELAATTNDYLYKIDINTGAKKLLAIPEQNYNISNLVVTQDDSSLYFTDAKTNTLHKIQLR